MEKEFYIKKAEELYKNKDYQNLFDIYKKLIEIEKNAKYYFRAGFALYMLAEYKAAIKYFEKAFDTALENKNNIHYYYFFYLGASYNNINEYKKAIKYLNLSLELSPYNHNIHRWIASSYYSLCEYKKALKYYTNVLNIEGNTSENLKWIGICHYRLHNYDEAIEYLEKSAQYSESNKKDYHTALCLGVSYYKMDKYKKAMENLLEAKEIDDDNDIIYYYMGLCSFAVKDYINAIENFDKQLDMLKSNNIYTICYLSICYYKLKDYKKHLKLIKKARELQKYTAQKYSFSKCL
ncbi:tetratricopeptide repeat protein [Brachyspira murdochii]|uniref:TPR repeat-containing protein n=1 Tax=Brachyspira murdochii TaxID=84378 RepID=A0ABX5B0Z2_9SPIR|nr:tetratricopeptide repeat protein [Brachyspira murdochii]PPS20836.1 hypothetical protein DJ52_14500 [Brachyspira murdochii]